MRKERQELCTLDLPTNLVLCRILVSYPAGGPNC